MIICDSREKKNQHVLRYFDVHNIPYRIQKLDVADYMLEGMDGFAIDRKQNLSELSTNLMNRKDHARFWKEVRRAKEAGMRMVVLCEHGGKIRSVQDVAGWQNPYSGVSGRALMDEIYRVHIAYGVEFIFCDKRSTGKRIVSLLRDAESDKHEHA
ncbi:MAG: ERCC4 domain-containing protein [Butyricicoccus sp.]|nr:ERCC4 domain-containing protein [Butyricicoccus sp.]